SANISFGDATWTVSALEDFSMLVVSGGIRSSTYNFNPINTGLVDGGIVLNFPLTVKGTDRASGDSFEYEYTASTQTFGAIPEPGTFLLLGSGLVGLMGWQWAKKTKG
ncbi:MAG: PEP-CTERM sorting domain-containing protein, partial [Nitrospirota bacterium]|nr:PEP-CTERM sorting domain-containing protein [Nitrospirota bacterium]